MYPYRYRTGVDIRFSVPRNPAKGFAGVPPQDEERFTNPIVSLYWWDWGLYYEFGKSGTTQLLIGIHMSCWSLAQWKLGPSIAENLELFVVIVLKNTFETLTPVFGTTNRCHVGLLPIYYLMVTLKGVIDSCTYIWQI